jgi:hypothetical protein
LRGWKRIHLRTHWRVWILPWEAGPVAAAVECSGGCWCGGECDVGVRYGSGLPCSSGLRCDSDFAPT